MFLIAWAVVKKKTNESWIRFTEHLKADLCIGNGLGSAIVNDMKKFFKNFI